MTVHPGPNGENDITVAVTSGPEMTDARRKKIVADAIFANINTGLIARNLVLDQSWVEVTRPSDLVTLIRVKTPDSGVHYYEVKVSEKL